MSKSITLIAIISLGTIGYKITEGLSSDAQAIIVTLGLVCLTLVSAVSMVLSAILRQRALGAQVVIEKHLHLHAADRKLLES